VGEPTGIGVYTLALLEELAARDDLALTALAHREPSDARRLRELGVGVETQPAPLGVLWQQRLLPRRLASGDFDVFWSPLLTLPRRVPIPSLVTLHDLTVLRYAETLPWKVRWSLRPFLESTVESARRIVVASRAMAAEVEEAFVAARSKVVVIPHGVDPEFRPADEDERSDLRERFDAPNGYVVAVGTLEPRKNLAVLLEAWDLLVAELGDRSPRLLLAGPEGWKDRRLRRRIDELAGSGVRRLGRLPRPELAALVRGAIALAYPSIYEGFGLPVAEAIASGVPAIVARGGSTAEVAADAGLTVEPDAPAELADALRRVTIDHDLREALVGRALERRGEWSWRRAADELALLFHECAKERS